jgi:hypothetical protein
MIPLIPVVLGLAALGGGAYYIKRGTAKAAERQVTAEVRAAKAELTGRIKQEYENALAHVKDVPKLRALADAYEKQGYKAAASMLRKRASLRDLPANVKSARRDAFRKALKSTNVEAVRKVADAFDSQGATGAAETLRKRAESILKAS